MKGHSISFVFPIYNELKNIEACIYKATSLAKGWCDDYEIIFVDDGSTDGSGEKIDELASKDKHIRPVHLEVNTRFGGALKKGLEIARKEVVIYTDADFSAREEDVKKAVDLLDSADIVSGYSLVTKNDGLKRILISKVYNWLVEILFGLHIRDINCGFKIYKKEVLKDLELGSGSPFVNVEIFAEARKRNFKIAQCGVIFQVPKGKSTLSRLNIMARIFLDMFYYRFSLRRPCP